MSGAADYRLLVKRQRRPGLERDDGGLDRRELVRLATLAASSHNTQPWSFSFENRDVVIAPDFSRRCPAVDPDDGHLFKSLGCATENVVHAAAAQGHAAEVSFDDASRTVRIGLEPSQTARPGPLFHAIPRRQCSRLEYDGRPLGAADQNALEQAGAVGAARTMLVTDRGVIDSVIDLVRQGDKAQFNDAAFRAELTEWLRFNDRMAIEHGDGLASRTAGQPTMPAWLARLVVPLVMTGEAQARTDEKNIRSSAAVAVIVSTSDSPGAWIEAGRAYERLALHATAMGIRHAFINQPIEIPSLRAPLRSLFGAPEDEHPLLMVRVGRGPEAPFSLRRPVEDVIVEDGGAPAPRG